jgi:hypothetical protein
MEIFLIRAVSHQPAALCGRTGISSLSLHFYVFSVLYNKRLFVVKRKNKLISGLRTPAYWANRHRKTKRGHKGLSLSESLFVGAAVGAAGAASSAAVAAEIARFCLFMQIADDQNNDQKQERCHQNGSDIGHEKLQHNPFLPLSG